MIKFLLQRPIATCVSAFVLFVLGMVSFNRLPVSLLPDVDIPRIVVQLDYEEYSAREMENNLSGNLRRYLQQVSGLKAITSESSYGHSTIYLEFDYGVNIDLAAIEVNEKIDLATPGLPKEMARPRIIKTSASDIPVFFLNMKFKNGADQKNDFLDLSRFAGNVIKKRLEQLSEVSLVDISGLEKPQISIKLNQANLRSLGITTNTVEEVIKSNNYSLGNIKVREGYYEYNIRFSSQMNTISEIRNLLLNSSGKIVYLKDIASIDVVPSRSNGSFMANGDKAISLAIIKQGDARMQDLKEQLDAETSRIRNDYPDIEFSIAQDQTSLLDYSISNLKQTLMYGGILAFIVLFLFIPNLRLPFLIAITVPISITISLLFFMLFGISINIISLSGLVLGVGLMIDNSIIVIDNITQFRERGESLMDSCYKATREIVAPLMSSAFTTSAIFIPLVFISGMAGALFYDQAITVTVSLMVSFLVSITLLPVLYSLLHLKGNKAKKVRTKAVINLSKPYKWGMAFVFKHKLLFMVLCLLLIPAAYLLFQISTKELFPNIKQNDIVMSFKWNQNITTEESIGRLQKINRHLDASLTEFNAWTGAQDYVLNSDYNLKNEEVKVYMTVQDGEKVSKLKQRAEMYFKKQYPDITLAFTRPENLFVKTFQQSPAPLIINIIPKNKNVKNEMILSAVEKIEDGIGTNHFNTLGQYKYINLIYNREMMMLYDIEENHFVNVLKTAFNQNNIGRLNTSQEVLPMMVGGEQENLEDILKYTTVSNANRQEIPITSFLSSVNRSDFEEIHASENGFLVPLYYNIEESSLKETEREAKTAIQSHNLPFDLEFKGSLYDFKNNLNELVSIMLLSIALLYFILAIQFESFVLPLIILVEIPMDIAGSLFLLYVTGTSINIMSIIGIIVMTGIIINDSILKIDTINRLYTKEGYDLMEAIELGGERRLRSIILTSLTTILALSPFFFGEGLGVELQRPLAITLAGGLGLGTLISLYFIPLCYWWFFRNNTKPNKKFIHDRL